MATEYGYRYKMGEIYWWGPESVREGLERSVRETPGAVMVAREVSEPRIVSIRA